MIYAYVVQHDIGFAPNPFFGVCTLACCKPRIRGKAVDGDWIVGVGSANDKTRGKLIYAMRVERRMSFDDYWNSAEFQIKKPTFTGSLQQAQGDNIYHQVDGAWAQERSRHTHSRPEQTELHRRNDTSSNCVLISREFIYFGQSAVDIPLDLVDGKGVPLNLDSRNTPQGRPRREKPFDDPQLEADFVAWLRGFDPWGYRGDPCEWRKRKLRRILAACY